MKPASDTLKRPLQDLRISVIDACNFRCGYCMPAGQKYEFLKPDQRLSFLEIEQIARAFVNSGVRKLRVTGGEPLLRPHLEELIHSLAQIPNVEDLSLTTNAFLLAEKAGLLHQAGLKRLTISCDSIREETFRKLSGFKGSAKRILAAIDTAMEAGFTDIKVNCVVQKGINDHEIEEMIRHFGPRGVIVRFIEFMDVGNQNHWEKSRVVPSRKIIEELRKSHSVKPLEENYFGEVAGRWLLDETFEIGFISSVSQPFCKSCTRARLSTEGKVYTCLFASEGTSLRPFLHDGHALEQEIRRIWSSRSDRYSEIRASRPRSEHKVEMYQIGG